MKINMAPIVVFAFLVCLGWLLGGPHGALLLATIWLGLVAFVTVIL